MGVLAHQGIYCHNTSMPPPADWKCAAYSDNPDIKKCQCRSVERFLNHFCQDDKNAPRTHLDQSGGNLSKINIPWGPWRARFIKLYAEAMVSNSKLFLIEHRSKVFPMFYDMDERSDNVDWQYVNQREYIREIQKDTRQFFKSVVEKHEISKLFRIVVAAAEPREYNGRMKLGIHLHFPNLYVTVEQARLLRASAIIAMEKRFKAADVFSGESWNDVLDECVYNTNGLRMLGSDKTEKCGACKRGKLPNNKMCTACNRNFKVEADRPYMINEVMHGDGTLDIESIRRFHVVRSTCDYDTIDGKRADAVVHHYRQDGSEMTIGDWVDAMALTSVATEEGTNADPRFEKYAGCPAVPEGKARKEKVEKLADGSKRIVIEFESENAIKRKLAMGEELVVTKRSHDVIKALFLRMNRKQYEHLMIQDATYMRTGRTWLLLIHVRGHGCSYCQNVARDHGSNRIYFIADATHITQRCFSKKLHNGKRCSDYKDRRVCLTKAESDQLFLFQGKDCSSTTNRVFNEPTMSSDQGTKQQKTSISSTGNLPTVKRAAQRNYQCAHTRHLYTMLSSQQEQKNQKNIRKRKADKIACAETKKMK